jgi:hypothetical protein
VLQYSGSYYSGSYYSGKHVYTWHGNQTEAPLREIVHKSHTGTVPDTKRPCYFFSVDSGVLGVDEPGAPESFSFLVEDFGPIATNTIAARNRMAVMVSIIRVLTNASIGIIILL